mmetsp:Transcript_11324/g.20395  ORF Transcript_11324/g.20395 Transcript_11324/m.20395 type:complete len:315 (-) Transcript_11324:236-1180(-)
MLVMTTAGFQSFWHVLLPMHPSQHRILDLTEDQSEPSTSRSFLASSLKLVGMGIVGFVSFQVGAHIGQASNLHLRQAPVVSTPHHLRVTPLRSVSGAPRPSGGLDSVSRREAMWLPIALAGATQLPTPPANAEETQFTAFQDRDVVLNYPAGWEAKEVEAAGRRKLLTFASGRSPNENINILFTPTRADYNRMGSFGSLEMAAGFFVPSGTGMLSTLLSSKSVNWGEGEGYLYEYRIQQEVEEGMALTRDLTRDVHFLTLLTLIPGKSLVTLTLQTDEPNWEAVDPVFRQVLSSFRLTGGSGYAGYTTLPQGVL